jgi:hypothetical protein
MRTRQRRPSRATRKGDSFYSFYSGEVGGESGAWLVGEYEGDELTTDQEAQGTAEHAAEHPSRAAAVRGRR